MRAFLFSKFNFAVRQEIQNQGAAVAHGRAVGAAGWADEPTCRASIKQRVAFDGHDEVDLALWMHMVWAGHVFHVDHVDGEAVQIFGGFEDAAIAQATPFVFAEPALGHAFLAGCFEFAVSWCVCASMGIEPVVQGVVEWTVVNLGGHGREACFESGLSLCNGIG